MLDFIKNKTGSISIDLAVKQQEQLSYFTQSNIQEEINETYLDQWANRKYQTNDHFLNWVKAIFKTENFLSFFKYFRQPLASSSLVNNKIKDALERVFHAEDSYFKYNIKGKDVTIPEELEADKFQTKIFNALLFNHNDIIVHDLKDINTPFREIISIKNVVAIESKDSVISRLCYTATVDSVQGYLYMDAHSYIFYNKDLTEILNITHDLGVCPADFIAKDAFKDHDAVRKSVFTYVRALFEELDFLTTLQRMTNANGVIPVVTELKTKIKKPEGSDAKTPSGGMSSKEIAGQSAEYKSQVIGANSDSPLNAGSRIRIDIESIKKPDGSIDMEVVKHFLNFHYIPTEALQYLNKRIQEINKDIIINVVGDYSEANEAQKNELQVSKSYQNKQDKLRGISSQLSRIRNLSDYKLLALKYGANSIMVDCFYGSDFFLESQEDLYDLAEKATNPIERKIILVRLSQNRNKFNINKAKREKILYDIIPFTADKDFDIAIARNIVDDKTILLYTRFTHWIGLFEATYGDIVFFWNLIEGENSIKLATINDLINNIIKEYSKEHPVERELILT